ncbi:MAG: type II toxin-antitoxin system HicA family toxin [Candidatus Paceibacterota bacterium]|jgi:predicted RNA binding protein YcfA (HicA-like mRNA interferase family)
MSKPLPRRELIRRLRANGFTGPFSGGKHEEMERGDLRVTIPNPHTGDISGILIEKIRKQAGISKKDFEK